MKGAVVKRRWNRDICKGDEYVRGPTMKCDHPTCPSKRGVLCVRNGGIDARGGDEQMASHCREVFIDHVWSSRAKENSCARAKGGLDKRTIGLKVFGKMSPSINQTEEVKPIGEEGMKIGLKFDISEAVGIMKCNTKVTRVCGKLEREFLIHGK